MTTNPTIPTSFDRAARAYAAHARVQTAMAAWLAEWLPAERGGRALEVGAGPGIFTRHLLPWAGDLTASDLSEAMCEAGQSALPGVKWRPMPAQAPTGGPWDWIFASSMLQWMEDPAALFAAWRTALRPRGRILAGLFAQGSLPEWRSLAGEDGPVIWRRPEEWRRHLDGAGFRVRREETAARKFDYASARVFLRSLHGVGAAPERRYEPGPLRRLLAEYERRYRAGPGVGATWVFHRFEAVRT